MKKIKFLTAFSTLTIIGTAVVPLSSCTSNKCTVIVQAGANGIVDTQSLEINKGSTWGQVKESIKTTPNKGYHFKQWEKNGFLLFDDYEIKSDICAVAIFEKDPVEQVTINFASSEGGKIEQASSIKVLKGTLWDDIAKPKTTANDNYLFAGWYNGSKLIERYTPIEESTTITAKFSEIEAHDPITPKLYTCDDEKGEYVESGAWSLFFASSFPITLFNDIHIGYLEIGTLFKTLFYTFFSTVEENYKTTISNIVHPDRPGSCTIDYKNQTITFENMFDFLDLDANSFGTFTNFSLSGGWNYFLNDSKKVISSKKGSSYTIDLAKYNINCIWHNNKGYIPFEFLKNVLNMNLALSSLGLGIPIDDIGKVDFTGQNLYQVPNDDNAYEIKYKRLVKKAAGDFYNKSYMEYVYNLLALTLDLRYGMTERKSRKYEDKIIKYLDGGALNVLKPYHDKIVSLKDDESSDAIRTVFREHLDDGGHSAYLYTNALSTRTIGSSYRGEELKYSNDVSDKLSASRKAKGYDIQTYWEAHGTYEKQAGYYSEFPSTNGSGDIAYITFDEFVKEDATKRSDKEKTAGRELQDDDCTTDSNYGDDTLRLTMYANKKIKANSNIKNVVLDMSQNHGGAAYTLNFMASWLCGGVNEKIYNPKTNEYCEYHIEADLNYDGKFDDQDYLDKDINLYIITSTCSFSCGNILPCTVKGLRENTTFIGHNTGGGPCIVDTNIVCGANSVYQISSNCHFLNYESTEDNFISMDDGIGTPDWIMDEWKNPDDFYDRDTINKKIWEQ